MCALREMRLIWLKTVVHSELLVNLNKYEKTEMKEWVYLFMKVQTEIEKKLEAGLTPHVCLVENESQNHNVPPGSESHFKLTLVSDVFDGKMLVARHKMIYQILADELKSGVHALALHTYTKDEWDARQSAPESPPCLGGGK